MLDENNTFNINDLLKTLFIQVEEQAKKNHTELIIQMDSSIPKLLRGDEKPLLQFFTKLFEFVFTNSNSSEIMLTLHAPDDFVYQEEVIFEIPHIDLLNDQSCILLKAILKNDLEALNGKIEKDSDNTLHIRIPFTLHELGFRRHYRLTDKSMLDKKVLIALKSKKLAETIKKYFQYFNYDINIDSIDQQSSVQTYNIVITEDENLTETSIQKLNHAKTLGSHIVWIGASAYKNKIEANDIIQKPITQEDIYLLIGKLFGSTESITKLENEPENLTEALDKVKRKKNKVLNEDILKENRDKAIEFLKKFGDSDIRFKELLKEKNIKAVKHCCNEVETYAKNIGAENLLNLVEMVKLVLQSGEDDMLAIFPNKYHKELKRLKASILK
ncbi:hypothetical protein SUN_0990 [Sulfurovum sp. NBC37-1]|nr:hypothetical protein SUN_0990 [Sulfurovum sp. NBC37-1]